MTMDARTLRARRKQRIEARTVTAKDDMPDWLEDKIEDTSDEDVDVGEPNPDVEVEVETDDSEGTALGAFQYNPVYQKPTHLGSDKPSGGYHYYGPLPDAGTSYGYYVDEANDLGIISPRQARAFSPISGKPMKYQGKVGIEGLASLLAASSEMVDFACGQEQRYCSAPLRSVATSKVFDVLSGRDVTASLSALAEDEDDDDVDIELELEDALNGDEDENDNNGDDENDEAESMDWDIGEGMGEKPMGAEDENDDSEEDMAEPPMNEEPADDDEPMEPQDDEPGEDDMGGDEEMNDEDLDQEIDDLMAEYDMDAQDEPPMEDSGDEYEGEMGGETHEDEGEEAADDMGDDEEMEPEEAVTYEALMNIDELDEAPISEADVHMTLFNEHDGAGQVSANPYWNIDIKGMPVARVFLQDQPKPEEIRRVFCSADYHRGVSEAIEKAGVLPVLRKLNAKVWANKVEETKLAKRIRHDVEAQANERFTAVTSNLMKDLLHRVALVCAGMDKNFYREEGNPLKEALWGEFHRFGIANPSPMIEAAFRRGATRYFETVLSKAVEYMEMDPKALGQVQKAIGEADILPAGDATAGTEIPDADTPENLPTLSQRLAASSVALGGIPALAGDAIGDHKQALRGELRLGGAGPQRRR